MAKDKQMKFEDVIRNDCGWLKGEGPESDVAISTRVRIARNIEGNVYFERASDSQRKKTLDTVFAGMKKARFFKNAFFLKMKDLPAVDRMFLVERHLMSKEHIRDIDQKALAFVPEETISAMINEEDHLRLQVLTSGFDIMGSWKLLDEIEANLCNYLSFDFSNKFGYLTSCPTNTGTGLRVSVMLHLSAIALTEQLENVFEAISKLGFTMRGFYGEGTDSLGDFFQISNQLSLGHSEMDLLDSLGRVAIKIIERERETRQALLAKKKKQMREKIERSFQTLENSRIITSAETVKLLSSLRLGAYLGLLNEMSIGKINEVLLLTQPAHLQKITGEILTADECDMRRADFLKQKLGKK